MARHHLAPEEIELPPSPPEPIESHSTEQYDLTAEPASYLPLDGSHSMINKVPSPTLSVLQIPPPRTRSPLAKAHLRSRSLAGSPAAPSMTRAHSSPGLDSRGRYFFSGFQSQQELPLRRPSPLRSPSEESFYPALSTLNISEPISEQPELQSVSESRRDHTDMTSMSASLSPGIQSNFPRLPRRRATSPLHPSSTTSAGVFRSSSPSPSQHNLVISTRFNEPYPAYSFSSGSSMPSTPSSIRSRSPSISSLETIPDIPDAEAAAIESDRIAKLKAAADKADSNGASRARNLMDTHNSPSGRFGPSRKRWSVCGAEGRSDLDLETIWED